MILEISLVILVIGVLIGIFFIGLRQTQRMAEQTKLTQKEVQILEEEINRIKNDLTESNKRLKTSLFRGDHHKSKK